MDALCAKCLIDRRYTTPYHPQGNGLVERFIATILNGLRRCAHPDDQTNWDQELTWIVMAYNCAVQGSLGYSPCQLMFSRPGALPLDNLLAPAPATADRGMQDETAATSQQLQAGQALPPPSLGAGRPFTHILDNPQQLPSPHQMQQREAQQQQQLGAAHANLERAQARQQADYQRRHAQTAPTRLLKPDSWVSVRNLTKTGKLSQNSEGPFRFLRYTSEEHQVCVLQDQSGYEWTCSADRVKRYVKRKKKQQPLDPEDEEPSPTAQAPALGATSVGAAAAAAAAGAHSPNHLLDPIEDPAARLPSEIDLISSQERSVEREQLPSDDEPWSPAPPQRPRRQPHPTPKLLDLQKEQQQRDNFRQALTAPSPPENQPQVRHREPAADQPLPKRMKLASAGHLPQWP